MNFAEVRFWEYLLLGLGIILGLRWAVLRLLPNRLHIFDKLALLCLGLFLLLSVSWVTFLIFLAVAVGTYVGLGWILKYHRQHASKYLLLLIPLQLLPLFFTKYANFLGNTLLGLHLDLLARLTIPVGISFYTFQKVAFVVDTLAFKHSLPRFLDYMNFAGFFPQIVAGPIERRADLLPQMQSFRFRSLPDGINEGASWIALGLFFKCCLADNLAFFFDRSSTSNAFLVWVANILFGLRIYYDFAGYSLIAVGIARCLGIRLTLNFLSPYSSTSITEFWRRWHITLSQWFRDYVYVPLGGNRVRFWALNILFVFIVSGIWHGAGWNFVLWGALHAVFLIANRVSHRVRKLVPGLSGLASDSSPNVPTFLSGGGGSASGFSLGRAQNLQAGGAPHYFGWALTMFACFFAWLCFYETSMPSLWAKMKLLLTPAAYSSNAFEQALHTYAGGDGFVLACVVALAGITLIAEWLSIRRRNEPYHYLRRPAALALLVIATVLLAPGRTNGFIYFAF